MTDDLSKARDDYRAATVAADLSAEAIAARKYVVQLERKVIELETRLRARPSRSKW